MTGVHRAGTRARTVADRDRTATRLLASSARNSYDPAIDIDWSAPVAADDVAYLPFERVSLYGTPLWDGLTHEQRVTLSRHELASVASVGLWFEIILMQLLARYAYDLDPRSPHTQYALTEIGDETRHVIMFARLLQALDTPAYRVPRVVHHLARLYKASAGGAAVFAPTLVAEEVTDRLQRATMNDETIHPLVRMVNRIHVVEEARHVRFAREELVRVRQSSGRARRLLEGVVAAVVASVIVSVLIDPEVYRSVGLDPAQAARVARRNPHHRRTRQWLGEKIMGFLREQGMVTPATRPIYRRASLI